MFASPMMIRARGLLRKLGITRLISAFAARREYEDRFRDALMSLVRKGDVIWDIGANVGVYTEQFSQAVGEHGRVVCFEPIPECYATIDKKYGGNPHIIVRNLALGDTDGEITMVKEDDPLATTHRIASDNLEVKENYIRVPIARADTLVQKEGLPFPNIVKIDVEGFEWEVLQGMSDLLSDERLRGIGIEVHFNLLAERGWAQQPQAIENHLRKHGYATKWVDPSHLIAAR
ncbi:FkbM family methyltransferase [Candidatus Parcubacteria bacterium]|nr:MAG: FkbM family methyltransferase [Candidatus Parcubacteria bacterium]